MSESFRGFTVCACIPPIVEAMEGVLGRPVRITQGGYNAGQVSQSAGTHDAGGVLDLATDGSAASDLELVRAGRTVGLWGWIRQPWEGPWDQHYHGAVIGCPHLSPQAKRQETDAYNGIDGLSGHDGLDPHRSLGIKVRSHAQFLEETDMPLSDADIDRIAVAVGTKFDWQKENYLQPILKGVTLTNANVWKAIHEIRGVDPVANVDAVALAVELTEILGPDLARQVATELGKRLEA